LVAHLAQRDRLSARDIARSSAAQGAEAVIGLTRPGLAHRESGLGQRGHAAGAGDPAAGGAPSRRGVAYALWLVPALRLIAPPAEWVAQIFATPLPSLPPILVTIEAAGEAAPPSVDGPGQWVPILLAVWAGGAILFLLVQALAYRRFTAQLSASAHSAGAHWGVPLIESAAVEGPLALGLLNRRIVVPADFEDRYSPAERQLALDHERYHHRRGDILANHAALIVLALNWFNPIAWASFRAFRADQELSCDAAIAAQASP
jgi:beta-lactamase regulating signal transducer with metallopeptidase domain